MAEKCDYIRMCRKFFIRNIHRFRFLNLEPRYYVVSYKLQTLHALASCHVHPTSLHYKDQEWIPWDRPPTEAPSVLMTLADMSHLTCPGNLSQHFN